MKIRVYQGEIAAADECELLGEFEFSGLPDRLPRRGADRGDLRDQHGRHRERVGDATWRPASSTSTTHHALLRPVRGRAEEHHRRGAHRAGADGVAHRRHDRRCRRPRTGAGAEAPPPCPEAGSAPSRFPRRNPPVRSAPKPVAPRGEPQHEPKLELQVELRDSASPAGRPGAARDTRSPARRRLCARGPQALSRRGAHRRASRLRCARAARIRSGARSGRRLARPARRRRPRRAGTRNRSGGRRARSGGRRSRHARSLRRPGTDLSTLPDPDVRKS